MQFNSPKNSGIGRFFAAFAERYARYVEVCVHRPWRAAGVLALLCVPALALTALFFSDVRAGLEELLPRSAPSVRALEVLHARLGGKANLVVIAQSNVPDDNRRFIRELTERLIARAIPQARSIQGSVSVERKWVKDRAPLLVPPEQFAKWMDEIETDIAEAKAAANPMFVDLGDEKPDRKKIWETLALHLDEETRGRDRFPNGYLESEGGRIVVATIWLEGSETELGPAVDLLDAVKAEVARLRPAFPPDLKVAYNGEVPNLIEEHDAILADLSLSTALVFVLVGALIVAYFRSLRAVAAVCLGLGPGILFTFAVGRLTVGHLNSNTAFLGSIILGNGINYPLLFLAYFRGRPPAERFAKSVFEAARLSLPGTLAAALTASAAYAGLGVSTFKGFSQFGWLGGMGMITTWIMTFVTMPIVVSLFNPPRYGERPTRAQAGLLSYFARPKLPFLVAGGFVLVTLVAGGIGVRHGLRHGLYEMNLLTMRNRDSLRSGSASWDATMSKLFGVWLNPVAAVVDAKDRETIAAEFHRALVTVPEGEAGPPVAERVETIQQFVPPPAEQEARLVRLRKLGDTLKEVPKEDMPARTRELIDAWFGEKNLQPITAADVPVNLSQSFTERSGRADEVVLIYPSLKIDYNDGRNILHFADRLHAAKVPPAVVTGGAFLFMAEIIRMVRDEAPRVVLVVCLLVAGVLLPFFLRRPMRIPLVVLTVAIVAVSAQAVMLALGVQLNMLNFAAVPITIGVGADYVVNLLGAMDAFGTDARRACARMGGAILLCSLTTVVGYLSLVLAQSGALRTFGWAAVLGEVMAVCTVLVVLPVVLPREAVAVREEAVEPRAMENV